MINSDGRVIIAPVNDVLSINLSTPIFNKAVAINIYIPSLTANSNHTKQVETIDFIISLFAFLNSIIQTAIIDNIECTPKFIGNNLITLIIKPKHIPYFNTFSLSILIPSNIIPDNTTTILSGKVLVII